MLQKRRRLVFERKRKTKRFSSHHVVHFGRHKHPEHTSYLTDFSDTGVCIKTDRVFQPGTKLHLTLEYGGKSCKAEGVVAWEKRVSPRDTQLVKVDMGVHLTRVEPEWEALYEKRFKETLDEHGYLEHS